MNAAQSAESVIAALQAGPMRATSHAWLLEVRNGTGALRQCRYADALVVSCWPSRGLWLAGVEVKVRRDDWTRELDKPAKAEEIQRWCDYWWIAAPVDVVPLSELPEQWGLYEVTTGGAARVVKPAPKLQPEPLTLPFLASVLRNQAERERTSHKRGRAQALEEAETRQDAGATLAVEEELHRVQMALKTAECDRSCAQAALSQARSAIAEFEKAAGLPVGDLQNARGHAPAHVGDAYRVAITLAGLDHASVAAELEEAARAMRGLAARTAPKSSGGS